MRQGFGETRVTVLLVGVGLLFLGLTAGAQPGSQRAVLGQVLDKNGKAVARAIVHLKNTTTKEQVTVVTNKEGRYRFNDLKMREDYEIYAEADQRKSPTRKISQFDTRERVVINLRFPAPEKAESKDEEEGKED